MDKKIWSLTDREDEFVSGLNGPVFANCEPRIRHIRFPLHPSPSEEQHLHLAVINGDLDTVRRLASERPLLLKEPDRNGYYPIHIALLSGHASIVDFLVDKERDSLSHYLSSNGFRVIHHAASARYTKLVIRLIEEFGFATTNGPKHQSSGLLLHIVAMSGNLGLLRYLVEERPERGEMPRHKLTDKTPYGETILMSSIYQDRLEVFLYLLERCPKLLDGLDSEGLAPFWSAVCYGATRIVAYMIDHNMPRPYPESWTPLSDEEKQWQAFDGHFGIILQSSYCGCLDLMRWMKTRGYQLKIAESEGTASALHAAAQYGHLDVVKFLSAESTLDLSLDKHGYNALSYACYEGHVAVAQFLHNKRPEAERLDPIVRQFPGTQTTQKPMLRLAARGGQLAIFQWLVESGISEINFQDSDGVTALETACEFRHLHIVEWLLSKGADPKIRNNNPGFYPTAFWYAVDAGELEILKLLHEHDPSLLWDLSGDPPEHNVLSIALERLHIDVCNWLITVDNRKSELERWNGTSSFKWPNDGLLTFQPVWYWKKRLKKGKSSELTTVKRTNPQILEILFQIFRQKSETSFLPALQWMVSVGVSLDEPFLLNTNTGRKSMYTPLEMAVFAKNILAVKFLVETAQVALLPLQLSRRGYGRLETALDAAIKSEDADIFDYLAEKVRERYLDFSFDSLRNDWCLLALSAFNGNTVLFNLLLDKYGASRCDIPGFSAWDIIACGGNVEIGRTFAERFPRLLARSPPTLNTFDQAIQRSHFNMVDFLLDELEIGEIKQDDKELILLCITSSSDTKMINHFYKRGVNMKIDMAGVDLQTTVLNEAVLADRLDIVKWLISIGISVNERAPNGYTPLHCACRGGYIEMTKWLLAQGASLSIRNPVSGANALDIAAQQGNTSLAQLLNDACNSWQDIPDQIYLIRPV